MPPVDRWNNPFAKPLAAKIYHDNLAPEVACLGLVSRPAGRKVNITKPEGDPFARSALSSSSTKHDDD